MKHPERDQINVIQFAECLLGRREFIIGAGGMVLSLGGLSLVGCGGAGGFGGFGTGGSTPTVKVAGTIGLPTGFSIPPTQLSVIAGLAQTPVKAPNAFAATIAGQSPSLAILQDSAGNGVMLGFLDPTKSNNTIDSHSTAVALIYFMLGGYTVPSANVANILNLISIDASMAALAQVIATRIVADPHAVQNSDAQIAAALTTSYKSIVPAVAAAVRNTGADATTVKPQDALAPALLVQPDGEISGVEVLQASSPLDIQLTNHFRRRCKVFVYKTGTQQAGGTLNTFTKVESFVGPVELPTVVALGLVEALVDLFQGTSPFTPLTIAPIPLTLDSGATKTLYEVIVLGSSANNSDPTLYSDPRYVDQVATFRAIRTSLNIQTLLADLVFGIFLEMLGIRQEIAGTVAVEQACDAMAALADAEWQAALALAQSGLFGQAAVNALKRVAVSSLVREDLVAALGPLLSYAQAASLRAASGGLTDAAFAVAEKMILGVIGATGVLLGFGDVGAVLYAMTSSSAGDLWTAAAFVPAFGLNPLTSSVTPGDSVTFTITAPNGITGSVEYDWTQKSEFASFSASDGTVGNSIKTTSASTTVDLITTPSDQGTITVTVMAYQVEAGGAKMLIGQVSAKVVMNVTTFNNGQVVQSSAITLPGQTEVTYTIYGFATFTFQPGKTAIVTALGYYGSGLQGASLTPAQYADPGGTFDPSVNFESYTSASEMPEPYGAGDTIIGLQMDHCYAYKSEVAAILFMALAGPDEVALQLANAQAVVASIVITFQ